MSSQKGPFGGDLSRLPSAEFRRSISKRKPTPYSPLFFPLFLDVFRKEFS